MSVDDLADWRRSHYTRDVKPELDGKQVTVFGWVEDKRDLGGIIFITLRDREGVLQVTVPKKKVLQEVLTKLQNAGSQYALGIRGLAKAHKEAPGGVELIPESVKILGVATYPLPLDPTGRVPADIDVRLDSRILDLRRPECRAIFKIRHEVLGEIRRFLAEQGFIEINTPKIIGSATEGGAALFSFEYFDKKAYLAQSPELYKEELTSVFEKVFEIGPVFRAEESHTRRHLNEYTSVDLEQAFANADDVMKVKEGLVRSIIRRAQETCAEELKILGSDLNSLRQTYTRYTYDQILNELKYKGVEIKWGEDIPTPAYRALQELHPKEFYFIVDWPTKARPFYIKPRSDKPELCYAFDFMHEWIEITSGGSRVDSKDVFIKRLQEQGLNPKDFESHIKVYDAGFPPHAGWGMGLERLLLALVGRENVREVTLFPRDRFRLTP